MISIEANVAKAAKTMCEKEVGSVIILQRNRPIGIVTEEDINCKVVAKDPQTKYSAGEYNHEHATHHGECG